MIKDELIKSIQKFGIDAEYVIVKPNWVSDKFGHYTEPEILDWVLEAFPDQKKIVIESYTSWRGLSYFGDLKVGISDGKNCWDFYKEQDKYFLEKTGIGEVLEKHNANYINITNEVWSGNCVPAEVVEKFVNKLNIKNEEFYSYIPKDIFVARDRAVFISLGKIKLETGIPEIMASLSIKNIFGLIPHPSRKEFHGTNHNKISQSIVDIYKIYNSLFSNQLWINEGIKTLAQNYTEPKERIKENKNLFFTDIDGYIADSKVCEAFGISPNEVSYLNRLSGSDL